MSRINDFKFVRWARNLNRGAQIVLCLLLWLALNFIAAVQFVREDLNKTGRYSLSPETMAYLRQIDEPVKIIVTQPGETAEDGAIQVFEDISQLLREYAYASRREGEPLIQVEYVNIFQNREKQRLLVERYGVDPAQQYAIIVAGKTAHREINPIELYEVGEDEVPVFKGEQAFTSTILDVSNPQKQTIYFLMGHGEMSVEDVDPQSGISQVAQYLRQRNYAVEPLDLSRLAEVPEGASLVVIAGSQTSIPPFEVEKLRQYLSRANGRMLIFLEPTVNHGLEDLFWDWGILADDMVVLDSYDRLRATGGDLLIEQFGEHPITRLILNQSLRILTGLSRPVREDPGAPFDERLTTLPLMATSNSSWAERSYRQATAHRYDENVDLPGPIPIAMLSERTAGEQLGLSIPGGRLITFGNADFIANGRFNAAGNQVLFANVINWMLDQKNLLEIPPRRLERFQLPLSQSDLQNAFFRLLALPGAVALLGIFVAFARRK